MLQTLCRGECPRPRRRDETGCCIQLPPEIYKRPDPLIYAQYYLMSQGLSVTWDNPDITILEGSTPVLGALKADHRYTVRLRVWNGSYSAPAVGLLVELSYLSFGIQTFSHPIGSGAMNLGAKGTAECPAFLDMEWTTPSVGGHYCLQARLIWDDDANPDNNLGQKNVAVAALQSPAEFVFTLRNDASISRRFVLEADSYRLPELPDCANESRERSQTRLQESRVRWDRAKRDQAYGQFPVPTGWHLEITPRDVTLEGQQEQIIQVKVDPRDAAFGAASTFNVHAFAIAGRDKRYLAGGVTLTIMKQQV